MPVSAVYEDCQAYEGGSSVGVECVEGGAYGAAGVEDVVNEDYGFAFNADGGHDAFPCGVWGGGAAGSLVVAVGGDVQGADSCFCVEVRLDGLDAGGESYGEGHAAGADADEYEVFYAFIGFNNFVGDAGEGAADFVLAEDGAADGGRVLRVRGRRLRAPECCGMQRFRLRGGGHAGSPVRTGCGYTCPRHSRLLPRLTGRI